MTDIVECICSSQHPGQKRLESKGNWKSNKKLTMNMDIKAIIIIINTIFDSIIAGPFGQNRSERDRCKRAKNIFGLNHINQLFI